jgi:hypothetical protein
MANRSNYPLGEALWPDDCEFSRAAATGSGKKRVIAPSIQNKIGADQTARCSSPGAAPRRVRKRAGGDGTFRLIHRARLRTDVSIPCRWTRVHLPAPVKLDVLSAADQPRSNSFSKAPFWSASKNSPVGLQQALCEFVQ